MNHKILSQQRLIQERRKKRVDFTLPRIDLTPSRIKSVRRTRLLEPDISGEQRLAGGNTERTGQGLAGGGQRRRATPTSSTATLTAVPATAGRANVQTDPLQSQITDVLQLLTDRLLANKPPGGATTRSSSLKRLI